MLGKFDQSAWSRLAHKCDRKLEKLLAGPLDHLLASGGDARLKVDAITGLNDYGCRASPRPEVISFASSTASTISDYGYAAAEAARAELRMVRDRHELREVMNVRTEEQRTELADLFGLRGTRSEIIFTPSGTDAQVYALCVARTILRAPVVSVVAASDETGSGADQAVQGKHFNRVTSSGTAVVKGASIRGLEGASKVSIPLRGESGRLYSAEELDAEVFRNVRESIDSGKSVLLYVMDHSKLGSRCPSDACVCEMLENWPDSVQVAVDACQLRVTGDRIRAYLDDGHMVIVTGSKFFGGPPFSGALLVPRAVSERMATFGQIPVGLRDYSNAIDWPLSWKDIRAQLSDKANIGQFLRWASSLAEMRNYFSVPTLVRRLALSQFASIAVGLIGSYPNLKLLPSVNIGSGHCNSDDEMAVRTIFPFLVYRDGAPMSLSETKTLYRALNRDFSESFMEFRKKMLSRKLCHIGQPVSVREEGGVVAGALRISCDARLISRSWFEGRERAEQKPVHSWSLEIDTVLQKLNLIRAHFDTIATGI